MTNLQETEPFQKKILEPQVVDSRSVPYRDPNTLWLMNSYGKLKPYGFTINGYIDEFSQQVMWMEAYTPNFLFKRAWRLPHKTELFLIISQLFYGPQQSKTASTILYFFNGGPNITL